MAIIPALFFSFWLWRIIRRNGFDVSACMVSIYALTSWASLFLSFYDYEFKYDNYSTIDISLIPTVVYCSMIGLCIYPFYKYNSNKKRKFVPMKNSQLFDCVVFVYITVFILLIIIFRNDLVSRIAYGSLDELRQMSYNDDLPNVVDSYSGIARFLATILTILGEGAYFMILFFFYSLCFLNKSKLYNILILVSSLSPIIIGFLDIDRSKTVFWILLFVLSYFFFKQYIKPSQKATLKAIILMAVGLLILYLAAVTISRFGERDEGALGGILSYLGQPFINFCKIWDNVWNDHFYTGRFLPITNYILLDENGSNNAAYVADIYLETGVHVNVFFSFVGMFLVDMGHFAAVLIPFSMFVIFSHIINRYIRRNTVTLSSLIILYALGIVVQCGIISYFYVNIPRVVTFWLFIFLSKLFYRRNKSFN